MRDRFERTARNAQSGNGTNERSRSRSTCRKERRVRIRWTKSWVSRSRSVLRAAIPGARRPAFP